MLQCFGTGHKNPSASCSPRRQSRVSGLIFSVSSMLSPWYCATYTRNVGLVTRREMDGPGLRLLLVLALLGFIDCRSTRQQVHTGHAEPAGSSPGPQQQQHQNAGLPVCETLVLSSLATFVTSGAGYADTSNPRHLVPVPMQQAGLNDSSTNSSEAAANSTTFEPTPPHKPLWPHWSQGDVWLFALSAVTLFIAAGGGIGGGAVFVPLFIMVGGFTAAQAVALSNITILGGAVANFLVNSTKRHAFRDTPLIDWDLILVFEPTTMLGALLGSYCNKVCGGGARVSRERRAEGAQQGTAIGAGWCLCV